ncbi:LemA family protein [Ethanoligenens harbinense YUAN-3]|uniref:LemA family protein n=2 Tax=Ethanoligenens harbinense TaxID=253239 RepID=E6U6T7_ETHHY|nr:LemA family protein [Ethanoligenens harbinense YUAN-3]
MQRPATPGPGMLYERKQRVIMRKKRTGIIVICIVALVVVIGFASSIGIYNGLVSAQENVHTAYSGIQTDLQRRSDLVPNLVATVQGYAKHEETVYADIANARAALVSAGNAQQAATANDQLSSALSRLLVIAEAYPDLKANQNFIDLQTQLEGTENRIAVARTKYNDAVQSYNQSIRSFPGSIIAGMYGFKAEPYFQAGSEAQQAPTVSFS